MISSSEASVDAEQGPGVRLGSRPLWPQAAGLLGWARPAQPVGNTQERNWRNSSAWEKKLAQVCICTLKDQS